MERMRGGLMALYPQEAIGNVPNRLAISSSTLPAWTCNNWNRAASPTNSWYVATRRLAACLPLLLIAPGCHLKDWVRNGFKVGPNYCRPQAPIASEWIDYRDPRVKSEAVDLSEWWRAFNDAVLNKLVETAYEQNLSL